ncbi:MAG TPA: hypothetical protein VK092_00605 [Deinococcales bacterium]|nr:hypothetical protein [Deinococcales bacterium]
MGFRKFTIAAAVLAGGLVLAQQPPEDVLVVASSNDPQSVDPAWEMDNHAWMVSYWTYDRLMAYEGETTDMVPSLA